VSEFAPHRGYVITASCLAVRTAPFGPHLEGVPAGMVNVLEPFARRQVSDLPKPSLADRCGNGWCRNRQDSCGLRRARPRYTLWPPACTALGPAPPGSSCAAHRGRSNATPCCGSPEAELASLLVAPDPPGKHGSGATGQSPRSSHFASNGPGTPAPDHADSYLRRTG